MVRVVYFKERPLKCWYGRTRKVSFLKIPPVSDCRIIY